MPSSKEGARSQTELENIVKSCTFNALVCVEVVIDLLLEIHKHTCFFFFLSDTWDQGHNMKEMWLLLLLCNSINVHLSTASFRLSEAKSK